jgi:hypothetical protein
MRIHARLFLAAFVTLAAAVTASAQEARPSLVVKGGATIENSEDGLTGTVPAFGLTGSFPFSRHWRGEAEFWLPDYIDDARGEPKHRDILLSFSAVRTFGEGRAKPFVLAGLSFSRTQDWFTFCTANRVGQPGTPPAPALVSCDEPDVFDRRREKNTGTDGYLLLGSGVNVALTGRLGLVADLRVSLAPASVLVRPAVGLSIEF